MKKILLLGIFIISCLSVYSQTLTNPSPLHVASGTEVTLTGSGESLSGYFIGEQSQEVWDIQSGQGPYLPYQSINFTGATYYSSAHPSATTLKFKLNNTSSTIVTVTYRIGVNVYDFIHTSQKPFYYYTFTAMVDPAPAGTYYNTTLTVNFTKNNCSVGEGSVVPYTVVAGTFSSTVSQADANAKATTNANTYGQAYANANGTCLTFLSGPHEICYQNEDPDTYTIYNLPTGVTVTSWTAQNKIKIDASTSTTAIIEYNATGSGTTYGTLVANLSNGTQVSKTIIIKTTGCN